MSEPKINLVTVSDEWLDKAIRMRTIAVVALGADLELLSALVELRDRRRGATRDTRGGGR